MASRVKIEKMLQVPLYFQLEPRGTAVDRRAGRRHCREVEVGRTAGSSAAVFANCSAAAQSPGSSVAAVFCGGGAGGGGAAAVPAPLDVDGVPAHVYGVDSAHPCSLSGLPPPVHMAFPGSCGTPFPSPMYAELPRIYNTLHCAS